MYETFPFNHPTSAESIGFLLVHASSPRYNISFESASGMPDGRQDTMTETPNGILLIDKPQGMTSHDVVHRIRRIAGIRRVGHTGTLDPMADGLLMLCLGPATRIAQFLVGLDKLYTGTITLGAISSTYDAEGEITFQDREVPQGVGPVRQAMLGMVGEAIQLPPPYSAIKVRGKKLYEYARSGEPVPQKPRSVHIHRFDLVEFNPPELEFAAKVGSGTYLRSMAHDLGLRLGCGAYLSALRRQRVGGFSVEDALPLNVFMQMPELIDSRLLSLTEALGHMPKIVIQPEVEEPILHGRCFTTDDILEFDGILNLGQPVLVLNPQGRALSIVKPQSLSKPEESSQAEAKTVMGASPMLFKPVRVLASVQSGA